jgi:hypothetical protein
MIDESWYTEAGISSTKYVRVSQAVKQTWSAWAKHASKSEQNLQHIRRIAVLCELIIDLQPQAEIVRVRNLVGWNEIANRAEGVEACGTFPLAIFHIHEQRLHTLDC